MTHTINAEAKGIFRVRVLRADGSVKYDSGKFHNLLTDYFFNSLANASYCRVGSGSTTPATSDTALVSQVAVQGFGNQQASSSGVDTSDPSNPFAWARFYARFAAGAAAGNLSEVGVSGTTAGNLISRALITDASGNPTTITVLSDEILDVTWELRLYYPLTDVVDTVVAGGTTYTITGRVCRSASLGSLLQYSLGRVVTDQYVSLYGGDAALGAVTAAPSASAFTTSSAATTYPAPVNGVQAVSLTLPVTATISGNQIGAIALDLNYAASNAGWQWLISPPIGKTSAQTLKFSFNWSLTRRAT